MSLSQIYGRQQYEHESGIYVRQACFSSVPREFYALQLKDGFTVAISYTKPKGGGGGKGPCPAPPRYRRRRRY
ncbi:hypothetical protein MSG28_000383 [Choristoneura fumiferana]|uniref:Uncharacterized protein n=1 Tax=Choristoneura fumiferana TaxID=7141 RepID=A0ACC0K152_CHOFU|nr:hypothetical protein MSG28_000383 [Choristoneura fumiferana]